MNRPTAPLLLHQSIVAELKKWNYHSPTYPKTPNSNYYYQNRYTKESIDSWYTNTLFISGLMNANELWTCQTLCNQMKFIIYFHFSLCFFLSFTWNLDICVSMSNWWVKVSYWCEHRLCNKWISLQSLEFAVFAVFFFLNKKHKKIFSL